MLRDSLRARLLPLGGQSRSHPVADLGAEQKPQERPEIER
jgi:hypothetical protein